MHQNFLFQTKSSWSQTEWLVLVCNTPIPQITVYCCIKFPPCEWSTQSFFSYLESNGLSNPSYLSGINSKMLLFEFICLCRKVWHLSRSLHINSTNSYTTWSVKIDAVLIIFLKLLKCLHIVDAMIIYLAFVHVHKFICAGIFRGFVSYHHHT